MFTRRKIVHPEEGKMIPSKIVGNVYFVGTYQASSHIIDTGDGLIMIDTGYSNTLNLVLESIKTLGFSPSDIKYIINTHWHGDHTEATAAMAEFSGAKTLIGSRTGVEPNCLTVINFRVFRRAFTRKVNTLLPKIPPKSIKN